MLKALRPIHATSVQRHMEIRTGTRYAMHGSATGRRQSLETRMKISRRLKEVHAQRKAAKKWVPTSISMHFSAPCHVVTRGAPA